MDYGACTFEVNGLIIKFRVAKITPTKVGQFVTLWKRINNGPIQPYDESDPFDFFVISARQENHFGQFVFSKTVLCEQGVISRNGKGGKRGIRVYPPWDQTTSTQARRTQKWQLNFFLESPQNRLTNLERVKILYTA